MTALREAAPTFVAFTSVMSHAERCGCSSVQLLPGMQRTFRSMLSHAGQHTTALGASMHKQSLEEPVAGAPALGC